MAKRRKEKSEEEEIDFKMPKFDEEKFMKKERRNIKTTFFSFIFGIIIAIISFGFWSLLSGNDFRWELVLLVGVFSAAWLKYFFIRLNIDLTDFGRKGWFTSYAIYLFTWLLVLMLLVNPPFYDDEPPRIEAVTLPDMQELGGTVTIVARISDNSGLEKKDIKFGISHEDKANEFKDDFSYADKFFTYVYTNPENQTGKFNFQIAATDSHGLKTEKQGSFRYGNDTIKLGFPAEAKMDNPPLITYAYTIKFDVAVDVDRVYYTVDGGKEINATLQGDYYETTPQFKGWPTNKNLTAVKVYAEVIHYFDEPTELPEQQWHSIDVEQYNNTIIDSETYYFQVGEQNIGIDESPQVKLPKPLFVQVPGFEILVFIISLIVVVLIFKYRGRHKRK